MRRLARILAALVRALAHVGEALWWGGFRLFKAATRPRYGVPFDLDDDDPLADYYQRRERGEL
jgi:hypothetical protein